MNKLFLLTCAIVLLTISCTHNKQENTAIIEGKSLENVSTIKVEWLKEHSADMKPNPHFAQVDSLGNFKLVIPVQQLSKGVMEIDNQQYDIILQPNDRISISFVGNSIVYSGKGAEKNNFVNILSEKTGSSKYDMISSWYSDEYEFNDFFIMIEDYIAARIDEFEKFSASHSLNDDYINYFEIENKLEYIGLYHDAIMSYARKNDLRTDSVVVPSAHNKPYNIKGLVNEENLINEHYLMILNKLMYLSIEKVMNLDPSLNRDSLKLSFIMDSLSGSTKEHYLAQEIFYSLSIADKYDSAMVASFNSVKSDRNCMNVVDAVIAKYHEKKAMIGAPMSGEILQTVVYDSENKKMTISDILRINKGKVIYLDTWSLGCGPCRMAMPLAKELNDKLKDHPIEFVYITVDNYSDNLWASAFDVSLTEENHYRFEKGFNSELHSTYGIMSVPTYILIDKKGHLISYNAERPFDNEWNENQELEKTLIELASKE